MEHMVKLAASGRVPALGQGTWYLGDEPAKREQEVEALREGIRQGMKLIDTAEMYGRGNSEKLVGDAIRIFERKDVFLVSKVLPENAGGKCLESALEASLRRLGTDYLDLYLYHWRGRFPLKETIRALEAAKANGLIRAWGVSNFDLDDMEELWRIPEGRNCVVNQVLYHMGSRGIEYRLLPWMRDHQVALMAYCPLAQGGRLCRSLLDAPVVRMIANEHGCPPAAIALAWVIRDGRTIAIPRTGRREHTLINAMADGIKLSAEELDRIDAVFERPCRKEPLDIQ